MRTLLIMDRSQATPLLSPLKEDSLAVEVFETVERADYKIHSGEPDAVVVDRNKLKGAGYSCLIRWRRNGVNAHVILLLPPDCASVERANCLDAGADGYLMKPINPEELRAQLRALKRRDRASDNPVRRIHDLEINTVVRTVKRAGKTIHLTPREFDLLQFLTFHQGKVVSRAMIREHLYSDQNSTYSNVVDVYIRYLRSKIDKGFDKPLILTRWGQGYLLRADSA